jgi:hypothetical protein
VEGSMSCGNDGWCSLQYIGASVYGVVEQGKGHQEPRKHW